MENDYLQYRETKRRRIEFRIYCERSWDPDGTIKPQTYHVDLPVFNRWCLRMRINRWVFKRLTGQDPQ